MHTALIADMDRVCAVLRVGCIETGYAMVAILFRLVHVDIDMLEPSARSHLDSSSPASHRHPLGIRLHRRPRVPLDPLLNCVASYFKLCIPANVIRKLSSQPPGIEAVRYTNLPHTIT